MAAFLTLTGAVIQAEIQTENTNITVRLFNRSGLAASPLVEGEKQAEEILQRAGIHVVWLNCPTGIQECIEPPNSTHLVLTILKQGSAMGGEDMLGLAVQDAEGSGTYCYVFENKLNQISGQLHTNISRLLGYAMAHELGHLLKGSHSHSTTGVMSALWSRYELEQLARGALAFTLEDASLMQVRLGLAKKDEPELQATRIR